MPLTPEDVSNKRFTPVRLREGYDMGEVDQFLDEVEAELERLTKENEDLRAKLAAAQGGTSAETPAEAPAEPVAVAAPAAEAPAPPRRIEEIKVSTAAEAASAATRLLELATRNSEELVGEAKAEAERIVGEARTSAERLQTETKAKTDRLEAETKVKTDRLEADARTRAAMLDSEAAAKRKEIFGNLEKERDQLSGEIENLRVFEREYRSRLKNYFTQQLETLEEGGQVDDTVAGGSEHSPKRLRSILGEDQAE